MKRKIITVSLIIAFSTLLWVFVSFSREFSITLSLPVEITDIPQELSVSSVSAKEITLSIKGQGWPLAQRTMGRNPKFYIPSPTSAGTKIITTRNVINVNSWLSSTLQLAEIHPEKISITMEKTVSKIVEVLPVLSLSYKPGYGLVSDLEITPDSVEITGPESIIKNISFIKTKGLSKTSLEKGDIINLELEEPQYVKLGVKKCSVAFDVQKIVDKTFTDLVVNTINIPSRYELILSPDKITLTLRGGINLLSKMKNDDIIIYVEFEQAINDTNGFVIPQIDIPKFTSIINLKPKRLEYIIKKY